jgi:uncharacterized RDD family membrane protein YckC
VEIAPFGRRLIALFADWTLSYFVAVFLASLGWGSARVLQYLVFAVEVILFTSITGSSIGQRLMKLRVISCPDGSYLPPQRVLLRTFLLVLVIPALFTKNKRGLHDVLAKSLIISA